MRRYALRDDQWDRIKDVLPGREGHVGGAAADNRLFVEAVLFRFRAGIRGAICLSALATGRSSISASPDGPRTSSSSGFSGFWPAITTTSTRRLTPPSCALTSIAPAPKKRRCASHRPIPRRIDDKIHALVDALGNPVEVMLSGGQAHNLTCAEPLIEAVDRGALIADRAFDADAFLAALSKPRDHPSHPAQVESKNPASVRFRPLLRTQSH